MRALAVVPMLRNTASNFKTVFFWGASDAQDAGRPIVVRRPRNVADASLSLHSRGSETGFKRHPPAAS